MFTRNDLKPGEPILLPDHIALSRVMKDPVLFASLYNPGDDFELQKQCALCLIENDTKGLRRVLLPKLKKIKKIKTPVALLDRLWVVNGWDYVDNAKRNLYTPEDPRYVIFTNAFHVIDIFFEFIKAAEIHVCNPRVSCFVRGSCEYEDAAGLSLCCIEKIGPYHPACPCDKPFCKLKGWPPAYELRWNSWRCATEPFFEWVENKQRRYDAYKSVLRGCYAGDEEFKDAKPWYTARLAKILLGYNEGKGRSYDEDVAKAEYLRDMEWYESISSSMNVN